MGDNERESDNKRIYLGADGEFSHEIPREDENTLDGEPSPYVSPEEFEVLRGEARGDPFQSIRHITERVAEQIQSYTPWQPGDPIRCSLYSDEYQDDISVEEEELAQTFLTELYEFQKQWPIDKTGRTPGRYYSLMSKGFGGPARADEGEAWGFDFLRQKYGDDIVDEYFANARQVYRGINVLEDANDRNYLALILYLKADEDHRFEKIFGEYVSPRPLSDSDIYWNALDRNDLLDIFAKQYIYFLRYVYGTGGKKKNQ